VDPVTLAVTLSNFFIFADDSTYGTSMTITALTATKYLAVYYISAAIASTPAGVTSVVIDAVTYQNGTLGARLFGKKSIFAGSMPTSVIRATALDANNVVVAYSDTKTNNGITCVALSINSYTGTIIYGSVLSVTTGGFTADNLPYNPTGQLDINLVTIKAGSQFMLMFSDLSLNGALVAVVGEVFATHFMTNPTICNPKTHSNNVVHNLQLSYLPSTECPDDASPCFTQLRPERRHREEELHALLHLPRSQQELSCRHYCCTRVLNNPR
jgi:hypothetical protein